MKCDSAEFLVAGRLDQGLTEGYQAASGREEHLLFLFQERDRRRIKQDHSASFVPSKALVQVMGKPVKKSKNP